MASIGATYGRCRVIKRCSIFEDVIELYQREQMHKEFPINIKFESEKAVDVGGVTREMYSAFWEKAYVTYFDGAGVVIPLLHAQMDIEVFSTLGTIVSHGYLASGYLPIRQALPSLIGILLGPAVEIPKQILVEALLEYLSEMEREKIKFAIKQKGSSFSDDVRAVMVSIFSRLGCRDIPTPGNLIELMAKAAKFEFCCKPSAAVAMMNSGVPPEHRGFWERLGVVGIQKLYSLLSVSRSKVLSLMDCQCLSAAEERVYGYLMTMIGNMGSNDLIINFLRFVTGSSVCIASKIEVTFNSSSGFSRSPFGHTCTNTVELPLAYTNYHDFYTDWVSILSDTNDEWKWRMDCC